MKGLADLLACGASLGLLAVLVARHAASARRAPLRAWLFPALGAKMLGAVAMGLAYFYIYQQGDTIAFFDDAGRVARYGWGHPKAYFSALWSGHLPAPLLAAVASAHNPQSLFYIRVLSLLYWVSAGNYWVASLYCAFVSFVGAWCLANRLAALMPKAGAALALALFFLPSQLFWASGVLKESLSWGAICALVSLWLGLWQGIAHTRWPAWAAAVVGFWWLWHVKAHYLVALLGVLVPFGAIAWASRCRWWAAWPAWARVLAGAALALAPVALAGRANPLFYLENLAQVLAMHHDWHVRASGPGTTIVFHGLSPDWHGLLANMPKAAFSGLFRPLLPEEFVWGHWFRLAAGVENLGLLLLGVAALAKIPRLARAKYRALGLATLAYCVLLGALLAISAPNFGTLARYKTGFLPFFTLLLTIENPLIAWCGGKLGTIFGRGLNYSVYPRIFADYLQQLWTNR